MVPQGIHLTVRVKCSDVVFLCDYVSLYCLLWDLRVLGGLIWTKVFSGGLRWFYMILCSILWYFKVLCGLWGFQVLLSGLRCFQVFLGVLYDLIWDLRVLVDFRRSKWFLGVQRPGKTTWELSRTPSTSKNQQKASNPTIYHKKTT